MTQYRAAGILLLILSVLLIFPGLASAQNLQTTLEDQWLNKNISLRTSEASNEIRFDINGERTTALKPGEWHRDTDLRITSVSIAGNELELRATRMDIIFDYQGGTFSDIPGNRTVRIVVTLPTPPPDFAAFAPVLDKVFLNGNEKPTDFAPEYWQLCLKHLRLRDNEWTCAVPNEQKSQSMIDPATGETVYLDARVRGLRSARPAKTTKVSYTKLAKQLRWQGTVVLQTIVDKTGRPTHIQIVDPLGYGLDDEAVQAITRWTFKPAQMNGKPVAMRVRINLVFQYQQDGY